jgi:hypothetical protein
MSESQGESAPLVLDWEVMWCGRHLEPFRPKWPEGAGVAMMKLFTAAAEMPAIVEASHADVAQLPQRSRASSRSVASSSVTCSGASMPRRV